MNTEDKIYRFNEIMATVELLPDGSDLDEDSIDPSNFALPNLTRDLADTEVYSAILCQSMKGDIDFRLKLCTTLSASAVKSIDNAVEKGDKPTQDDIYALAIAANIMWASGSAEGLFHTLNMIGRVCSTFDLDIPSLAMIVLRPNKGAEGFGNLDPYDILKGMTIQDVLDNIEAE